jgi:hypothetical protein
MTQKVVNKLVVSIALTDSIPKLKKYSASYPIGSTK